MPSYRVTDGNGSREIAANGYHEAATAALPITGRVAGVQRLTRDGRDRGVPRFYVLQGRTFFPVSAQAAGLEVWMGG